MADTIESSKYAAYIKYCDDLYLGAPIREASDNIHHPDQESFPEKARVLATGTMASGTGWTLRIIASEDAAIHYTRQRSKGDFDRPEALFHKNRGDFRPLSDNFLHVSADDGSVVRFLHVRNAHYSDEKNHYVAPNQIFEEFPGLLEAVADNTAKAILFFNDYDGDDWRGEEMLNQYMREVGNHPELAAKLGDAIQGVAQSILKSNKKPDSRLYAQFLENALTIPVWQSIVGQMVGQFLRKAFEDRQASDVLSTIRKHPNLVSSASAQISDTLKSRASMKDWDGFADILDQTERYPQFLGDSADIIQHASPKAVAAMYKQKKTESLLNLLKIIARFPDADKDIPEIINALPSFVEDVSRVQDSWRYDFEDAMEVIGKVPAWIEAAGPIAAPIITARIEQHIAEQDCQYRLLSMMEVIEKTPAFKTDEALSKLNAAIPNIVQMFCDKLCWGDLHSFIKLGLCIPELREATIKEVEPFIPTILDKISNRDVSGSGWGGYRNFLQTIAPIPAWAQAATPSLVRDIPNSLKAQGGRWLNVRKTFAILSAVPAWQRATEPVIAQILPKLLEDYYVSARGGGFDKTAGSLSRTLSAIWNVPAWRGAVQQLELPSWRADEDSAEACVITAFKSRQHPGNFFK